MRSGSHPCRSTDKSGNYVAISGTMNQEQVIPRRTHPLQNRFQIGFAQQEVVNAGQKNVHALMPQPERLIHQETAAVLAVNCMQLGKIDAAFDLPVSRHSVHGNARLKQIEKSAEGFQVVLVVQRVPGDHNEIRSQRADRFRHMLLEPAQLTDVKIGELGEAHHFSRCGSPVGTENLPGHRNPARFKAKGVTGAGDNSRDCRRLSQIDGGTYHRLHPFSSFTTVFPSA